MLLRSRVLILCLFGSSLLLSACASKVVQKEQFSGFLPDYSQLQEVKLPDGSKTLRWALPGVADRGYTRIYIEPVAVYPAPRDASQVDAKTVQAAAAYLNGRLQTEFGKVLEVVDGPMPGAVRLRVAITGVETRAEDFKAYEVIPIALIVAGVTSAAGTRDRNVDTYLEVEVRDASSGELLGLAVKKGISPNTVENKNAQVTLGDVKPTLDQWAKDGAGAVKAFLVK